ncbi:MAG: fibronectin/fibrinogen-binding protein [Erysipelotrichaceae bacterium]|nr:fibronectin/fibrinogen-binding protein [Erysipelotrichaceae bacterium]
MALDGILLSKIIPDINLLCPAKINKIYNISNTEIIFHLRTNQGKKKIMISCHPLYNRINITEKEYPTPSEPSNFVMLLRKHIEGSMILEVKQGDLDRWCYFKLSKRNTLGDKQILMLYVELMGKYANIILVDENSKVIDALKRIPPFENNKRTIHPGANFNVVLPQEKQNPFQNPIIDRSISLTSQLSGFSPLLSKEVEYRLSNNQLFKDIIKEIEKSNNLYISYKNNEAFFHIIELTHIASATKYELHEGIDILYYHKEEKDRIKQLLGDVYKVVKRELKHNKAKLPKLMDSLTQALDNDKYRVYGELLYAYNINDTKGLNYIELNSFEDNSIIKIPLDSKIDGKANARKMFQKYEKLKKGADHIKNQIKITQDEIEYFEGINQQLEIIDFVDAKEIVLELVNNGYLKANKSKLNKKKKKQNTMPNIKTIQYNEDTKIYVGKNNIQNDTLTFKIAKKQNYWFHTKDFHGSHVVVDTKDLNEDIIRTAANIAAYFSKGRYSSSVPVNYCQIKDLKKIPGTKLGKVSLTSYKTIYIDPDENLIRNLFD